MKFIYFTNQEERSIQKQLVKEESIDQLRFTDEKLTTTSRLRSYLRSIYDFSEECPYVMDDDHPTYLISVSTSDEYASNKLIGVLHKFIKLFAPSYCICVSFIDSNLQTWISKSTIAVNTQLKKNIYRCDYSKVSDITNYLSCWSHDDTLKLTRTNEIEGDKTLWIDNNNVIIQSHQSTSIFSITPFSKKTELPVNINKYAAWDFDQYKMNLLWAYQHSIIIFNISSNQRKEIALKQLINSIKCSSKGVIVYTRTNILLFDSDFDRPPICLWEFVRGTTASLSINKSKLILAVTDVDKAINLFDLENNQKLYSFAKSEKSINRICWSSCGNLLAVHDLEYMVSIWSIFPTLQCIFKSKWTSSVSQFHWSPNSHYIAVIDSDDILTVIDTVKYRIVGRSEGLDCSWSDSSDFLFIKHSANTGAVLWSIKGENSDIEAA